MYIDAKKIGKRIHVSERGVDGVRTTWSKEPRNVFYYADDEGDYESITGVKLAKFETTNFFEFRDTLNGCHEHGIDVFESDINPLYRLLEDTYTGDEGPELNISVLDIEVDKDPDKGFATINDPYAEINAITIHNKWCDEYYTLIVSPPNLTDEECRDLLDGKCYQDIDGSIIHTKPIDDDFGALTEDDGYFIVESEEQLLRLTLELIEDADVITGWNSEFFDIPYIVHRIRIVIGEETALAMSYEDGSKDAPVKLSEQSYEYLKRLCVFPCAPTLRMTEHFGSMEKTYQLHGRVHLDYLALYRKFTYEELHSYTLDFILEHEIKQNKVVYDGSLDQLYRNDIRRFTAYSKQDVKGLSELDDKMRFIELANTMAHMSGVTLDKTLGSVVFIEQAILRELHKQNLICFDKREIPKEYPIPGAFVLNPEKGIYDWPASYDFNSLYPTVIRMLNISPETIVGWVYPDKTLKKLFSYMTNGMEGAEAWSHFAGTMEYESVINDTDDEIVFHVEGEYEYDEKSGLPKPAKLTMTGQELNEMIIENDWVITAFGLVLHREKQGIIPYVLTKWYEGRVANKAKAKAAWKRYEAETDKKLKAKHKAEHDYYDLLQLNNKIALNSAYGSLLNAFCRFYDPRQGASVTMSGRMCLGMMVDHAEVLLNTEKFHDE